jgi:hypothetical protein
LDDGRPLRAQQAAGEGHGYGGVRSMTTVVNGMYHAMAVYVIIILIWLFVKERRDWEKSLLVLVAAIPLVVRVLRIR